MIGRTLDHYRIESKLGEGGMGAVYLAHDTRLKRPVAIKALHAESVANPERKRRFVQEAQAASALNHPNIITIYDIASAEGVDFIAMEYVAGQTLDRAIDRGRLVSALGGEARLIARHGRRPHFSPDGSQIAYWVGAACGYSSPATPGGGRIFVVTAEGGSPRQVQPEFDAARYPVWAPDGKRLLFLGLRDSRVSIEQATIGGSP